REHERRGARARNAHARTIPRREQRRTVRYVAPLEGRTDPIDGLFAEGRDDDEIRFHAGVRARERNFETVVRTGLLREAAHRDLEGIPAAIALGEGVGSLERVEDDRETAVEDPVENEHRDVHGPKTYQRRAGWAVTKTTINAPI